MRVAIIGAGIAGLTAARKLSERGVDVNVIEKSRGVGGRLANKRLDWATVDIGAQYFTARDERFQAQVARWEAAGVVVRWNFTPYSCSSSGLTSRADATLRYVGTPNMNSLAHQLADALDIKFSTRVHSLRQEDQGWRLVQESGELLSNAYDWVVLSAPAEQSRDLLAGTPLASTVPKHIHEPCWALALATRGSVAADVQGVFGDDMVSWVSRLSSRPQRPEAADDWDDVWMLHFASGWSSVNGKETDKDIAQTGFDWLVRNLAEHIMAPLEAVHAYQHYWRYARVAKPQAPASIIFDADHRIAAIGDWAHGGRVEGGYLSALDFMDRFDMNHAT